MLDTRWQCFHSVSFCTSPVKAPQDIFSVLGNGAVRPAGIPSSCCLYKTKLSKKGKGKYKNYTEVLYKMQVSQHSCKLRGKKSW